MGFGRAKLTNPTTSSSVPCLEFPLFFFFCYLPFRFSSSFPFSLPPSKRLLPNEWFISILQPVARAHRRPASLSGQTILSRATTTPRGKLVSTTSLSRATRFSANSFRTRSSPPRRNWLTENEPPMSRYSIPVPRLNVFFSPSSAIFSLSPTSSSSTSALSRSFTFTRKRNVSIRTSEDNKIENWKYFPRVLSRYFFFFLSFFLFFVDRNIRIRSRAESIMSPRLFFIKFER